MQETEEKQLDTIVRENNQMLAEIKESVKSMRSYLFWAFVAIVASVVLPLIGMIFVIPMFINRYTGMM